MLHKIEWSNDLSVGIKSIDNDHKQLILIINKLIQEIEKGSNTSLLVELFDELKEYTHYHFNREERLMVKNASSAKDAEQIKKHFEQHKHFIETIPYLQNKLFSSSSITVSFEVIDFLTHWLIDHILTEDVSVTEYFSNFKTKKIKNSSFFNKIINTINRKLSLSKRALLIIAIPIFSLFLVSLYLSYNAYGKYHRLNEVKHISSSFINLNRLMNNIQKERALSSAYIVSNYTHFRKDLQNQRAITDQNLLECKPRLLQLNRYGDNRPILKHLDRIQTIRKSIDKKSFSNEKSTHYYTKVVQQLIKVIKLSSKYMIINSNEMLNVSLLILLNMKENNALLRNQGLAILQHTTTDINAFKRLSITNITYFNSLKLFASDRLIQNILTIEKPENCLAQNIIEKNMLKEYKVDIDTIEKWFHNMYTKINAYEHLIGTILKEIDSSTSNSIQSSIYFIVTLWSILLLIIIFTLFISYALIKSIIQPIKTLTQSMQDLAKGDKIFHLNTYQNDDFIGKMVIAFNNFRRSLIKADFANILLDLQEQRAENFEKMAHIDPLTEIYNRRKFMEVYPLEFEKAHSSHHKLSLLTLDLDRFKIINDNFGHDAGDHVLKEFSKTVQMSIRHDDLFARVGGEEFSILLPEASKEIAVKIAQKIIKNVRNIKFDFLHKDIKLTVSIGVATYQKNATMDSLQKEADDKLYEAKHRGRDQVRS